MVVCNERTAPVGAAAKLCEAQRTPQLAGFGTQLVEWSKAKGEGGSERERERARRRERERRGTVEWWGVALRTFSVASVASMLLVVVSETVVSFVLSACGT